MRVWGIVCLLCALAILVGWLCYARLSRSAEFIEERFNYKLLEDLRWQDIVWSRCDPLKKDAQLAVTYSGGETSFRFAISIFHATEGIVEVFPADGTPQAKSTPLAVYRYHQRELTATQSSLVPEDRALVQRAAWAVCEFLRKSL
jgi:hypothetical protein